MAADIIARPCVPRPSMVAPRQSARPTWAEISLSAVRENFAAVKQHVGPAVAVCAVIKADAYGHGATPCALSLEAAGAKWLGVTTTDEGMPLRSAGVRTRILLMTGFWQGEEEEVVRQNLTATVWEPWHVDLIDRAARRLDAPPQPIHLKIDTGMGRLGVALPDVASLCQSIRQSSHVVLEGVSTHLAASEVLDSPATEIQLENFEKAVRIVQEHSLAPSIFHMDNTGGILARPETWKNMVRPGIALYGYALRPSRGGKPATGQPALSLEPAFVENSNSFNTRVRAGPGPGLRRYLHDQALVSHRRLASGLCGRLPPRAFESWTGHYSKFVRAGCGHGLDGPHSRGCNGNSRRRGWR